MDRDTEETVDRAASPQGALRAPEVWTSGLVTLALCLYRLDARQFWRDEQATWWVVQLSDTAFRQMLQSVDAVMAPYYLIERALVSVWGDSPFVMRLPSALAMGAAGAFMAAVAGRLIGTSGVKSGRERTFAWFSGLAFATIPSISYYGQRASRRGRTSSR